MSRLLAQPLLFYQDANGKPLPGALCNAYLSGTSTRAPIFQNSDLSTPHANPIVALTNGYFPAIYVNTGIDLKLILTDAAGANPLPPIDPATPFVLTQGEIGSALYPQTEEEDGANITPVDFTSPTVPGLNVLRYANVTDDAATDCTAAILAACNAIGGVFVIPPRVLYDRKALIAGLDADVVLLDFSQINDLTAAGETTKNVGIVTSDLANNDAAWSVSSGHHAGILLNNFGSSGTDSATKRLATVIWGGGMFQNGGLTKRGSRGIAAMQFGQEPGQNYWSWKIQSYAPWLSAAGDYEDWKAGEIIAGAGLYRRSSGAHYVSSTGGTTASPGPSHTSGASPDGGGVQWTFLDSADRGVFAIDQHGRILQGEDSFTYTVEFRPSRYDPDGGVFSMMLKPAPSSISKTSELHLWSTNGSGTEIAHPFLRAITGTGLSMLRPDASNALMNWDGTTGVTVSNCAMQVQIVTVTYSTAITIDSSLGNSFAITATDGVAFAVNAPQNLRSGRRMKITIRNTSGGALGTVSWNAIFKMAAWTSPATANSRTIEFEYNGTFLVECSRTPGDVPN